MGIPLWFLAFETSTLILPWEALELMMCRVTYSGLKKHLISVHGDGTVHYVGVNKGEFSGVCENFRAECQWSWLNTFDFTTWYGSAWSSKNFSLQASRVANSTVQHVVISVEELVNDIQYKRYNLRCNTRETRFSSVLGSEEISQKVEAVFDDMDNPFTIFKIESKRMKYYRVCDMIYVESKQHESLPKSRLWLSLYMFQF